MKLSLYQIQSEHLELAQKLLDNGGELTPELEEQLAINEQSLQTKGINYGFIIKEMEAECDVIDSEIARLTALKKSRSNAVTRLKTTISQAMEMFGVEEIKIPTLKLNFRKSESVEIVNEGLISDNWKVTKEVTTIDKIAIRNSIKRGEPVAGAELVQHKNLQVK